MCTTLVVSLLKFSKIFVFECDTSSEGIGEMFMKVGHPLYFISKQLCNKNFAKYTYEKEMLVIIHVVDMWNPYLMKHFF
jgi:hypothetical protein